MPSNYVVSIASATAAAVTANVMWSVQLKKMTRKLARPAGGRKSSMSSRSSPFLPSAKSCPEIEALKVKPGWHPDGSPEERVKQLGLELDGRIATNPAGTARSVSMNVAAHAHTDTNNDNNSFYFRLLFGS